MIYAAESFIGKSNPEDEVFVLNFNDSVTRGLPEGELFSCDIAQLSAALDRGTPRGMTALNDAVVEGLKQLDEGRRDKKALIVISDGGDNASLAYASRGIRAAGTEPSRRCTRWDYSRRIIPIGTPVF